jgi:hypothetical protein
LSTGDLARPSNAVRSLPSATRPVRPMGK